MSFLSEPYEPKIRKAIAEHLPDIPIQNLKIMTHGTECVAAELNDSYILKFPLPERTLDAITAEYKILQFLQGKLDLPIPAPEFFEGPHPFLYYKKIDGLRFNIEGDYLLFCPQTPREEHQMVEYVIRTEKEKDRLAEDLATFFAQTHAIDKQEVEKAGITLSPACVLSPINMGDFAKGNIDPAFGRWMDDTLARYDSLKELPEDDKVFGHFDCTSGNMLFDIEKGSLSGIFDFGNAQIDDYHRDISCMNLTAPALTLEVAKRYERLTGRSINQERLDFYTTFMHFYCITELSIRKIIKEVQLWQRSLYRWNHLLVNQPEPIPIFPDEWKIWVAENIILGTSIHDVIDILEKEGFAKQDIEAELYLANLHPYVMAARRCQERNKTGKDAKEPKKTPQQETNHTKGSVKATPKNASNVAV